MTAREVRKYGVSAIIGPCELCMYRDSCKDIQIGFKKPKDCDGPFYRYEDQY